MVLLLKICSNLETFNLERRDYTYAYIFRHMNSGVLITFLVYQMMGTGSLMMMISTRSSSVCTIDKISFAHISALEMPRLC